jgi:hypothetical protein
MLWYDCADVKPRSQLGFEPKKRQTTKAEPVGKKKRTQLSRWGRGAAAKRREDGADFDMKGERIVGGGCAVAEEGESMVTKGTWWGVARLYWT